MRMKAVRMCVSRSLLYYRYTWSLYSEHGLGDHIGSNIGEVYAYLILIPRGGEVDRSCDAGSKAFAWGVRNVLWGSFYVSLRWCRSRLATDLTAGQWCV